MLNKIPDAKFTFLFECEDTKLKYEVVNPADLSILLNDHIRHFLMGTGYGMKLIDTIEVVDNSDLFGDDDDT